MNERQLQTLLERLWQKTSYVEFVFGRHGVLKLDNRLDITGGSATARAPMTIAVNIANPYELESGKGR